MFCCKKFEHGIDGTSPIQRLIVFKARVSSHEHNKQNHRRCIVTAVAAFAVPDDTVYTISCVFRSSIPRRLPVYLCLQWNGDTLVQTFLCLYKYTNYLVGW